MKKCTVCKVEKETNNFYKHKGHKDGLRSECKECKIKTMIKYSRSEKGKKAKKRSAVKYRRSASGKKAHSNFMKSEKGKIVKARNNAKRNRDLGFVSINNPFPNSNGHHLNDTYVLYIPVSLHRRFPHNHKKLETMELINESAIKWYFSLT